MRADEIVAALGLAPHPEGGFYREIYRAATPGRAPITSIYFLLSAGQTSHWHRIDAAEVWNFHGGAPLELKIVANGSSTTHKLGARLLDGERPQAIVPPNAWQSARSLGDWTLVGCTVGPGFEFDAFELAPPDWSPDRED